MLEPENGCELMTEMLEMLEARESRGYAVVRELQNRVTGLPDHVQAWAGQTSAEEESKSAILPILSVNTQPGRTRDLGR